MSVLLHYHKPGTPRRKPNTLVATPKEPDMVDEIETKKEPKSDLKVDGPSGSKPSQQEPGPNGDDGGAKRPHNGLPFDNNPYEYPPSERLLQGRRGLKYPTYQLTATVTTKEDDVVLMFEDFFFSLHCDDDNTPLALSRNLQWQLNMLIEAWKEMLTVTAYKNRRKDEVADIAEDGNKRAEETIAESEDKEEIMAPCPMSVEEFGTFVSRFTYAKQDGKSIGKLERLLMIK